MFYSRINPCFFFWKAKWGLELSRNSRTPDRVTWHFRSAPIQNPSRTQHAVWICPKILRKDPLRCHLANVFVSGTTYVTEWVSWEPRRAGKDYRLLMKASTTPRSTSTKVCEVYLLVPLFKVPNRWVHQRNKEQKKKSLESRNGGHSVTDITVGIVPNGRGHLHISSSCILVRLVPQLFREPQSQLSFRTRPRDP